MSPLARYALTFAGTVLLGCGPSVSTAGETQDSSSSGGDSPSPTSDEPDIPTTTTRSGSEGTSSSGSTTSSLSSSEGDSGSGYGFLDPTETGHGDLECDAYLQDCPDGEKCNPWANDGGIAWNALHCFPVVPSPDQPGEPCKVEGNGASGVDTCDVGSMCWNVDIRTKTGTCIAMCEGSAKAPTCADPASSCFASDSGVINLCLSTCDPLLQNCGDGNTCFPIGENFVCSSEPVGSAQPGDACDFTNTCGQASTCISAEAYGPGCNTDACCSSYCDLTDPGCEDPNQVCEPFFEGMAPLGLEHVGLCRSAL